MRDINNYRFHKDAGIYRLNAAFDNYHAKKFSDMNPEELAESIQLMIEDFNKLPIPPKQIFIFDEFVSPDWGFDEEVIITNEEDLIVLVNNFVAYIDQIPFAKGEFNPGIFSDDPNPEKININTYRKVFGVRTSVVPVNIKMCDIPPLIEKVYVVDARSNS